MPLIGTSILISVYFWNILEITWLNACSGRSEIAQKCEFILIVSISLYRTWAVFKEFFKNTKVNVPDLWWSSFFNLWLHWESELEIALLSLLLMIGSMSAKKSNFYRGFLGISTTAMLFLSGYGILKGLLFFSVFFLCHVLCILAGKFLSLSERPLESTKASSSSIYLGSIAHEIKNCLNSAVITFDQLNESQSMGLLDKSLLSTGNYSLQMMRYLVGHILDATKLEAGKFEIDLRPVDLLSQVLKILEMQRKIAKHKGLRIYFKCLTRVPICVHMDILRLAQVLINILGNAIKFTEKGYIGVLLRLSHQGAESIRSKYDCSIIPSPEVFQKRNVQKKKTTDSAPCTLR
eukprot:TRINITY_DN10562_c0_g1_i1.p1 TRINITY_DN10562_c0_g1~~TRINITY_DN10562_c0_g1_i1.p1  ORF type:complete len:384 (+),score=14.70 TRINITY_DN10562_c0_g1_i1:106-1152(+)